MTNRSLTAGLRVRPRHANPSELEHRWSQLERFRIVTPQLILRVPTAEDAKWMGQQVVALGAMRGNRDPYGDDWVKHHGPARADAFAKMVNKARESLLNGGPFSLPLIAFNKRTGEPVGFFEASSEVMTGRKPDWDVVDLSGYRSTGKFETVAVVTMPNVGAGVFKEGIVAIHHLMFDKFGGKVARADLYDFNTPVQKILAGWGWERTGAHISYRPGYRQLAYETELTETQWPGMFDKIGLSVEGDNPDIKIFDLDGLKAGLHPGSELRSHLRRVVEAPIPRRSPFALDR